MLEPSPLIVRMMRSSRRRNESNADPVLLDPGNSALVDRGVVRQHQAKMRGYEGRVLNIDSGTLGRNIPYPAAHDGTARRHIGLFVDLGPWVLSPLFHQLRPWLTFLRQR